MEYTVKELEGHTVVELKEKCKKLGIKNISKLRKDGIVKKLTEYYCTHEPTFRYMDICPELQEYIAKYLPMMDLISLIQSSKQLNEQMGKTNNVIWKNIMSKHLNIQDNSTVPREYPGGRYDYWYELVEKCVSICNRSKSTGQYAFYIHMAYTDVNIYRYVSSRVSASFEDTTLKSIGWWGSTEVVKYISENMRMELWKRNVCDKPFYFYPLQKDNHTMVKYLVDKGVILNFNNYECIAIPHDLINIQYLHEKGCDLRAHNNAVFKGALRRQNMEVINYCLNNGIVFEEDTIKISLKTGDVSIMNLMLERDIVIDVDKYEDLFLKMVGNTRAMRYFIDILGFAHNNKNNLLDKALIEASTDGYSATIMLLIQKGANVSYNDYECIKRAKVKAKQWPYSYNYLISLVPDREF